MSSPGSIPVAHRGRRVALSLPALLVSVAIVPLPGDAQETLADTVLVASDGVRVHATWYRSADTMGEPVIVLFHQGGASGLDEYLSLIHI